MEKKVVPKQIYEDDAFLAFLNPVDQKIDLYKKETDAFHNKYVDFIETLNVAQWKNPITHLLYRLLMEKRKS